MDMMILLVDTKDRRTLHQTSQRSELQGKIKPLAEISQAAGISGKAGLASSVTRLQMG